jgi:hypothetical protein
MTDRTDREVAFREAGHAAAYIALGRAFKSASIVDDEGTAGLVIGTPQNKPNPQQQQRETTPTRHHPSPYPHRYPPPPRRTLPKTAPGTGLPTPSNKLALLVVSRRPDLRYGTDPVRKSLGVGLVSGSGPVPCRSCSCPRYGPGSLGQWDT